jgi:hypothetical protein
MRPQRERDLRRGIAITLTSVSIRGMAAGMTRLIPIGVQDFRKLRERGFHYVDKTAILHQLITGSSEAIFLSRPRRFGKSLLCSTFDAILSGRRELFGPIAGQPALAIDSLDWDWKKRPVIRLQLSGMASSMICVRSSALWARLIASASKKILGS